MKILMIDTALDGHHIAYLGEIVRGCTYDFTLVLPQMTDAYEHSRIITYSPVDLVNKEFVSYVKWMKELAQIAKKEKPDIVHFLVGDVYYKYFGFGLGLFKEFKTIITLHWVREGVLNQFSLKTFCHKVNRVVVHSSYLLKELQSIGVNNGLWIEYPQFKKTSRLKNYEARAYWKISENIPVILSLGNTRKDKGIDLLIEALNKVDYPFQLLIAGKAEEFDGAYIKEHTKNYATQVTMHLQYLTDKEVEMAIAAADIIALPYRHSFNGASGPLGEGVSCEKCIVGSRHGNLGDTIQENHLGYTFETENIDDMATVLKKALKQKFLPDDKYRAYKESLNPELFIESYKNLYCTLQKD
ncbi:glycosyltransferase family 4 protein [Mediterraneibacter faecis]|uniref:glycosyltransferase family 4 protein n=1 Tax=Mediterraneibacter faecis TaxID=592978 RepID=UPI0022E2D307|nr:glycosyltransferase family 4 protein [Mediterraneibacter faecis]